MRRLHIEAKDDHVLRLAHRDQPITAVIELVWNSLDAEAHFVNVVIERDGIVAVERVRVEDDGHGIPPGTVQSAFEHLGGSWKATAKLSPNLKRRMNGSKGQGRIRGFALGNAISWSTVARDAKGDLRYTTISGRASDPTNFDPTDSAVADGASPGTVFVAEDAAKHVNRITADSARPRITATFAVFLTSNPDVTIRFDGADLDPVSAERHRADYPLADFAKPGQDPPILRIIEWATDPGRAIHLCDLTGSVLETVSPEIHTPGFNYTAYVLWEEFDNRREDLLLAELQAGEFAGVISATREQIKVHFRAREAQHRAEQVQKWKDEGEYPYDGEPTTEAERAERETFDFVATTVARKIPKSQLGRRTTLGLLRIAVANEPSALPQILDELMPLPKREQEDLARLLVRTSMSKLIEANTMLHNRLDFLAAFRDMVFDPSTSKLVKERKELHKILEKELWVFGEEYALLASDRGLDEVLARHLATLRPEELGKPRSGRERVRRADGSKGIVDLMLSQLRRGVDRREHLIVELKRPAFVITQTEVAQIKSYADGVASDPQFHGINIHWDFWVISSKLDSTVTRDANQSTLPPGQIAGWDNIRIWAKTWSQIIEECEMRLRHFRDAIEYDATKEHAVDYINRAHDAEHIPEPLRAESEHLLEATHATETDAT